MTGTKGTPAPAAAPAATLAATAATPQTEGSELSAEQQLIAALTEAPDETAPTADAGEAPVLSHAEQDSGDSLEDAVTDPPAEAEGEADAEAADTETESEAEAEAEAEDEPKPQVPLKRLNKEVARRKGLEAERDELKAELAELKAAQAETPATPAATGVDDAPEVAQHRQKEAALNADLAGAKALRLQARNDPEGVAARIKAALKVDVAADPEDLRDFLTDYIEERQAGVGEVREQLQAARAKVEAAAQQTRAAVAKEVLASSPWVKDPEDARTRQVHQALKHPVLKAHPLGLKIAVALVDYEHRRQAAAKVAARGKTTATTTTTAAPATVRPAMGGGGGGKPGQAVDAKKAAERRFQENPSEEALLAMLAD